VGYLLSLLSVSKMLSLLCYLFIPPSLTTRWRRFGEQLALVEQTAPFQSEPLNQPTALFCRLALSSERKRGQEKGVKSALKRGQVRSWLLTRQRSAEIEDPRCRKIHPCLCRARQTGASVTSAFLPTEPRSTLSLKAVSSWDSIPSCPKSRTDPLRTSCWS